MSRSRVAAVMTVSLWLAAIALTGCSASHSDVGSMGTSSGASTSASPGANITAGPTASPSAARANDIAFVRGRHIWRVHPDGSGAAQITTGKSFDFSPAWSPDRQTIAFVRAADADLNAPSSLCIVPAAGGPIQSWELKQSLEAVCFSPDGRLIALGEVGPHFDRLDVAIFDTRTHKVTRLVRLNRLFDVSPTLSWSPDGKRLLVGVSLQSADGNRTGLLTIATKKLKWLNTPDAYHSRWSPDGRSLVVSQFAQDYSAISLARPDGTITRVLIRGVGWTSGRRVFDGCFSPDGRRISYRAYGDGGDRIWTIGTDGTGKRMVVAHDAADPVWSSR